MERKDFLKAAGLVGIGTMLPFNKTKAAEAEMTEREKLIADLNQAGACVHTPALDEGPYPFDLSGNNKFFRQDMREGMPGVQFDLTLTVVNIDHNCEPVPNIRVDAWNCTVQGLYSAHTGQLIHGKGNPINETGKTFMRGIQLTDRDGKLHFTTIYPGWYAGRAIHIHLNFFVGNNKKFTTQLAFPNALTNQVFMANKALYDSLPDTTNESDGIFGAAISQVNQYCMLDPKPNATTGGYDAAITVYCSLGKSAGVETYDPSTGGQFKLSQNYPNPFSSTTTIPFTITNPSNVLLELFDMQGRKVRSILNQHMDAGEQKAILTNRANGLDLAAGNYVYQLTVENEHGRYHQCKVLAVE